MDNMSYCRFRNTLSNFLDCSENLYSLGKNDKEEIEARTNLIRQGALMLVELGVDIDLDGVDIAIENIYYRI